MRGKTLCLSLMLTSFVLLNQQSASAQTNTATSPRSDQALNDLLTEVRLLRQDLRKLSSTTYRANTMIERLRIQQGQVNRLTQELSNVQGELLLIKSRQIELKDRMTTMQRKWDIGAIAESELTAVKAALDELSQREPQLTLKESELTNQLTVERATLEELNRKLDAIEQELLSVGQDDDKRTKRN